MRLFVLSLFTLVTTLYGGGALYFYEQERWARAPEGIDLSSSLTPNHPEANLGVIRHAFESNNFSEEVLTYVNRALAQAPSFYQPPFLLATYHATRVEEPELTRRSFEAALRRYPANGRLHLAYARWLLVSRLDLVSAPAAGDMAGGNDMYGPALTHVETALRLEPDLTGAGLELLQRCQIPPRWWGDLVPEDVSARRQLFRALARSGHRTEGLALLREMLQANPEPELFREAANWALRWNDPALAIEYARSWQQAASGTALAELAGATFCLARAHLAQGQPVAAYRAFRDGLKQIQSRSAASSPAALELLCGMAYEYLGRGQTVMAESLFTEASTLAPYYTPASLGLARTYRRTGDRPAAIKQYQKVLRLDPGNSEAGKEVAPLILERELAGKNR